MKLNYNQYCYRHAILIDNIETDDVNLISEATKKLIKHIIDTYGVEDLFSNLMSSYGDYEFDDKNFCEQCGSTDTIISLNLD